MSEPTWRDDLDNLLATAGEAQWVEEADERLTALLTERDTLASRLASCELMLTQRNAEAASAGLEAQQLQGRLDRYAKLIEFGSMVLDIHVPDCEHGLNASNSRCPMCLDAQVTKLLYEQSPSGKWQRRIRELEALLTGLQHEHEALERTTVSYDHFCRVRDELGAKLSEHQLALKAFGGPNGSVSGGVAANLSVTPKSCEHCWSEPDPLGMVECLWCEKIERRVVEIGVTK